jgi:RHS repeat-associated protein
MKLTSQGLKLPNHDNRKMSVARNSKQLHRLCKEEVGIPMCNLTLVLQKTMFILKGLTLCLFMGCFGSNSVLAQSDKQAQRGFTSGASYAPSDIETINTSNGNVMLNIQLASLPVNQGGSPGVGVSLHYNGKIFDPTGVLVPNYPSSGFTVRTLLGASPNGNWRYGVGYGLEVIDRRSDYSYPYGGSPAEECYSRPSAADVTKVRMRFPDGSAHDFRPTGIVNDDYYHPSFFDTDPEGRHFYCRCLQPNGCTTGTQYVIDNTAATYVSRTYYSSDGTYQKLIITFGAPDVYGNRARYWTLSLSDGTRVSNDPTVALSGGHRILDRNNNYTDILDSTSNGNPATRIVDQLGRNIVIERGPSGQDFVYANGTGGVQLRWTIQWTTTFVNKTYYAQSSSGDTSISQNINTGLLVIQSITLPAQLGALSYSFEYNGGMTNDYPNGGTVNPSLGWGEISKVTVPSGANVNYSYKRDGQATAGSWDVLQNHPVRKELRYLQQYDGSSIETAETSTYVCEFLYGNPSAYYATVTGPDGGISSEIFNTIEGYAYGRSLKSIGPDGRTVERIWLPNKVLGLDMNAYLKTEFVTVPGGKTAIKDYSYDKNGNLTKIKEYDWVDESTIHGGPGGVLAIPQAAEVKRVTSNAYYSSTPDASDSTDDPDSYYNSTAPRLRNVLSSTEIQNGIEQPVSRTEFTYDDYLTTGNLTEHRRWDSTKGVLPQTQPPLLNVNNSIVITTGYTQYGMPRLITDPRGVSTQITYGQIGTATDLYPTQIESAWGTPLKRTKTLEYDFSTGLVKKATDVDNNVTTSTIYDPFGRPTLVKQAEGFAEGNQTSTEYFDGDRRVVIRRDLNMSGDGKVITVEHYDQLGRVRLSRQLEDASQSVDVETTGIKLQTRYRYSGSNSYKLVSNPYRAATSDAAGSEQTMGWTLSKSDTAGKILEVQSFAGSGLPAPWGTNAVTTGTVTTSYDAMFTTVTDQANRVRRSKIDGLGRLVRVDEPSDAANNLGSQTSPTQATSYEYDALENFKLVTQGNQTRNFNYTSLGRLKDATNPEGGTINYEYDDDGNLTKKIDPRLIPNSSNHRSTIYAYDGLGRVTSRTYDDSTPNVSYSYDAPTVAFSKGRLTGVSSTVSSYSYNEYDRLGRLKNATQTTDGQAYTMSYAYNAAGAMISQTYPSGRVVETKLDGAGRIAGIQHVATSAYYAGAAGTDTDRFQYASNGAVQAMKLGNGLWEHTNFNSRLQTVQIGLGTSSSDSSKLRLDYAYGLIVGGTLDTTKNNGNIQSQTMTLPGVSAIVSIVQNYEYDELNRLKNAQEMGAPGWTEQFSYDRFGNRVGVTVTDNPNFKLPTSAPEVDPATNRLKLINAQSQTTGYDYDDAGNLVQEPKSGTAILKKYSYDAENHLIQAKERDGAVETEISTYNYDADGRRVKTIVGGVPTIYVYDLSGRLIAEYGATSVSSSGVTYVTSDMLGSTRLSTGSTLQAKERHDYLPFGEEIPAAYSNRDRVSGYGIDTIRQKFTAYERDVETGLGYAINRYYGSVQGRFTSVDSLMASATTTHPQTWNRYAYCGNSPLIHRDTNGLDWWFDSDAKSAVPTWFKTDPGGSWRRWTSTYSLVYFHIASQQWVALDPNSNTAFITKSEERAYVAFQIFVGPNEGGISATAAQRDFWAGVVAGTSPIGILYIPIYQKNGIDTSSREFAWGAGFAAIGGFGSSLASRLGTVRVGRWMSQQEYQAMVKEGMVQESTLSGVTSVTVPPNPNAYLDAAPKSVFVEFDVPAGALRSAGGQGWGKIYGPNSMFAEKLGITQMPAATGIVPIVSKIK